LAAGAVLFSSGPRARARFALTVLLSDGASLFVRPNLDEAIDEGDQVADWEVFTPYERCLEVGPGL